MRYLTSLRWKTILGVDTLLTNSSHNALSKNCQGGINQCCSLSTYDSAATPTKHKQATEAVNFENLCASNMSTPDCTYIDSDISPLYDLYKIIDAIDFSYSLQDQYTSSTDPTENCSNSGTVLLDATFNAYAATFSVLNKFAGPTFIDEITDWGEAVPCTWYTTPIKVEVDTADCASVIPGTLEVSILKISNGEFPIRSGNDNTYYLRTWTGTPLSRWTGNAGDYLLSEAYNGSEINPYGRPVSGTSSFLQSGLGPWGYSPLRYQTLQSTGGNFTLPTWSDASTEAGMITDLETFTDGYMIHVIDADKIGWLCLWNATTEEIHLWCIGQDYTNTQVFTETTYSSTGSFTSNLTSANSLQNLILTGAGTATVRTDFIGSSDFNQQVTTYSWTIDFGTIFKECAA